MLADIMDNGFDSDNRTGVKTRALNGYTLRFDLQDGFPLVTTKKIHTKSIIHELLWLISGSTNIKYLKDNGVRIWDEWTDENGDLGPVYSKQWREWEHIRYEYISPSKRYEHIHTDQLANAIDRLKTNPDCRRIIVSAWNVGEIDKMALPPCHCFYQFLKRGEFLDCILYQRSCDSFLGVPFNIASYSLLLSMVCQITAFKPGHFIWNGGSVHIYHNHFEQVREQLSREPYPYPQLKLNPSVDSIDSFTYDDFNIVNYGFYPAIKAEVAV